jgi:hypothetical protein
MRRRLSPAAQGEADKAIKERDYLYRRYRAQKKVRLEQLYQEHPDGTALAEFAKQLQRYTISDAAAMLSYVRESTWLSTAPTEIRVEALSLISDRITAIRLRAGLPPFDDPFPDEPNRVFQACKEMLRC